MNYQVKICRLNNTFYQNHPYINYPEIMHKDKRPYMCLVINIDDKFFTCIPFRSHINHNNVYLFKYSKRSQITRSGLDYSKIIIVDDTKCFASKTAIVDRDEYIEVVNNIDKIVGQVKKYVNDYVNHVKKIHELHPQEFIRRYYYSTLSYFYDYLVK